MEIRLTQNQVAVIDDEDAIIVSPYRWHARKHRNTFYARTHYKSVNGASIKINIHKLLMGTRPGLVIDHINGNGLDNRRCNLRFVTLSQNQWNRKPRGRFKGVYFVRHLKKWKACITKDWKEKHLGVFQTPLEAAKAYNTAAKEMFGDYARLNQI